MKKENDKTFITKYIEEFLETNLTESDIELIENKIKNNEELTCIFNKLCKKTIPIVFNEIEEPKEEKRKVKLMNSYLEKENYKIVIKNNSELKKSKDKEQSIINKINYMILPLAIISLNENNHKSVMILNVYGFDRMICANVMINTETFANRKWINKCFGNYNININESEYIYIKAAVKEYINENICITGLNNITEFLEIKNYEYQPSALRDPFPALHRAHNRKVFDGNDTFVKLLDGFHKGDYFEYLCMVSFLSLSFINGKLMKEKKAPNFILQIQRRDNENSIDKIKYIFGNRFNDRLFSFKDTSESNYFNTEYNFENIHNYIISNDNNVTILNLFYKIEENIIHNFEANLFQKYYFRNTDIESGNLHSNIVMYSDFCKDDRLYFKLKIGSNIDNLPDKEFFNQLLWYYTKFIINEKITDDFKQKYSNLCDEFEAIKYTNDISKNQIYRMTILTYGLDMFLRFGLKLEAINSDEYDEILQGFKRWIINKVDIPENTINEEIDNIESIDVQVTQILQFIREEFDKAISSDAATSNSYFLKKGVKPDEEQKYIGWYYDKFDDAKFKNDSKKRNKEVVYLDNNFIDNIKEVINVKLDFNYDEFKNYLSENKLILTYKSDNHLEKQRAVYPSYKGRVIILSINAIKDFIKF